MVGSVVAAHHDAALGVSVTRFARLSRCFPPHFHEHCVVGLVVEGSRRLIGGGMPLREAAACTGFADQAHFSRAFKQVTGLTPGQYARMMRAAEEGPQHGGTSGERGSAPRSASAACGCPVSPAASASKGGRS